MRNFDEVTHFIEWATLDRFKNWVWIRNPRCKYIELRIDMRSGDFIIRNRDGEPITFEQLKWQYRDEATEPPNSTDKTPKTGDN